MIPLCDRGPLSRETAVSVSRFAQPPACASVGVCLLPSPFAPLTPSASAHPVPAREETTTPAASGETRLATTVPPRLAPHSTQQQTHAEMRGQSKRRLGQVRGRRESVDAQVDSPVSLSSAVSSLLPPLCPASSFAASLALLSVLALLSISFSATAVSAAGGTQPPFSACTTSSQCPGIYGVCQASVWSVQRRHTRS